MDLLGLKDCKTVITGGASGIGREIAMRFAEHGSDIAILDIDETQGKMIEGQIKDQYHREALFIPCDISDYQAVKEASRKILDHFQNIDHIVCAAGYGSRASIDEMELSEWHKSVDVNLNGTFYIIHCLIKDMIENKKGNIIIIGSATIETGGGGGVHYSAAKTAQYGIMRGLAYELISKGIRSNIITPHIIDTPMLRKRYPDNRENNEKLAARVPLGRIGRPSDIANLALFLASDASEYICGEDITADGGAIHYR